VTTARMPAWRSGADAEPNAATVMTNTDLDLLETRVATSLASLLHGAERALPSGVDERLRVAREQALSAARQARPVQANAVGGGAAALTRLGPWWPRLAAALPILLLVVGSWQLTEGKRRADARAAAAVDAALLADDLPPAAYADPGFVAFLKLQQP